MSFTRRIHPATGIAAVFGAWLSLTASVAAQERIVEWVDFAPVTDANRIALGYPVPVPVDTPLPFAGFRSYAGLHARHQDLALTSPWVHGVEIGQSRASRPIWLYRLGDADSQTVTGLPEQAMLTNAGIHAREWQSPEVATGIIEWFALNEGDRHLADYLRDNANVLVIPVLNVDGFLLTQKYPRHNWLGTDDRYPDSWPRDGRMRRKNMLGVDEQLDTRGDHLAGIDLNRNNEPFWASPTGSSSNPESLIFRGEAPLSEPETRALDAAARQGPADRLSMYTDVHSYSQVLLWDRSDNDRLARLTERLLASFSAHHQAFPAGKYYHYNAMAQLTPNVGIGTTAEYFTHVYQVPSWTLEVEPSGGDHPGLPGAGADYGGLGRNGHDGFILPESEVERVRTQLAETFAIAYYQQAGPPAVRAVRLVDSATGAVVFDAEWDTRDATRRTLFSNAVQSVQLDRDYDAWIAWDKPMRWRENGDVAPLPGKLPSTLEVDYGLTLAAGELVGETGPVSWLTAPGGAPAGSLRYRDDAMTFRFRLPASPDNQQLASGTEPVTLSLSARDMVGTQNDANPETVAAWENGAWAGYEDASGTSGLDRGGPDRTIRFPLTAEPLGDPFVVEPGTSAAWFDPSRDGEGFVLEMLTDQRSVMYWFTYDDEGRQDWYIAVGEIRGNRILFPDVIQVSGGVFGPDFDPEQIVRTPVGSATFTWSSCEAGTLKWVLDRDGRALRQGRMNLTRLSSVMGIPCGQRPDAPAQPAAPLSGSWYDPDHSGEGYVLEVLADGRNLVYWFSFDADGARRWFFGVGAMQDGRMVFDTLHTTGGARFGADFDSRDVTLSDWGSLELDLGCDGGTAHFEPIEDGFAPGRLDLVRLTVLDGLECDS